jgi:predicted phosphoribosyltransferase
MSVAGRTVVVVDDGIATGATMAAALDHVRSGGPARLVARCRSHRARRSRSPRARADETVCLQTPPAFDAVGRYYRTFPQIEDDEVIRCLEAARRVGADAPRCEAADDAR